MWQLRVFEIWLTSRLLRSPAFHKGVRTVHKKVHELRHGKDPAEMGGTKIDDPGDFSPKQFANHFFEELKQQFRGGKQPPRK